MIDKIISGNEAIVFAALLSECKLYVGYPITPTNEAMALGAELLPRYNQEFRQAESEIIAINMAIGASQAGSRVVTTTSGPGLSLMQEGISYAHGMDLPIIIYHAMRGGPGLGNISPSQSDYDAMIHGFHGDGHNIVLAPNSPQEVFDLTCLAFHLADKYLQPVVVAVDADIARMTEQVDICQPNFRIIEKPWAVRGDGSRNIKTSYQSPEDLERILLKRQDKEREISAKEQLFKSCNLKGAKYVLVAYGISARIAEGYINGHSDVGLIRLKTLWPFPQRIISQISDNSLVKGIIAVEMSMGQMFGDLEKYVSGKKPVGLVSRLGGMRPTYEDIENGLMTMRAQNAR